VKRIHYDKFGDGRPICGTALADYISRDITQVTCRRCRYSSEYTLSDFGWGLLSKFLERIFHARRAGEHEFHD